MYPRVVDVVPKKDYMLFLEFNNGEKKTFDVKPYLMHPFFKELNDKEKFKRVKPGGLSIEWASGQDISPDDLYYNSK